MKRGSIQSSDKVFCIATVTLYNFDTKNTLLQVLHALQLTNVNQTYNTDVIYMFINILHYIHVEC